MSALRRSRRRGRSGAGPGPGRPSEPPGHEEVFNFNSWSDEVGFPVAAT